MKAPRVTLDQWHALQAVIEHGGYSQAAEHLNRSQSAVSYAVRRIEELLGTEVLVVRGRRAELTEAGEVLLQRARELVEDAGDLEQLAAALNRGLEHEIHLVVDAAFPFEILVQALKRFASQCPQTLIQFDQVVLSGADDLLASGTVDLAICHRVPPDMLGDPILNVEFVAVAHPDHALHQCGDDITLERLRDELQIVVRDSGSQQTRDMGWLGATHQWTVPSLQSSLQLVRQGMGYAWLPCHLIDQHLHDGSLNILPLREGQRYSAPLYRVYGSRHHIGPATRQLAEILQDCTHAAS